jgi:hypothetical protein
MNRLTLTLASLALVSCTKEKEETAAKPETPSAPAVLTLHPSATKNPFNNATKDIVVREDPAVDGWQSEAFSVASGKQLKLLGIYLTGQSSTLPQGVLAPSFSAPDLRPDNFEESTSLASITVKKSLLSSDQTHALPEPFLKNTNHFKFKIIRVDLSENEARTTALLQISGTEKGARLQINATWNCLWSTSDPPTLLSITPTAHEEVSSSVGFADCTRSAIGIPALIEDQLIYGRNHWYRSLESSIGVEGRGNGITIGDINNDGLEDLYLCQPAALPNKLLLRKSDGSLRDISASAGVDWLDATRAALFIDLDNDGDQDLILTQATRILFHENAGNGTFPLRHTHESLSLLFSINAVDYDGDGRLDLFASGYSGAGELRPEDIFASPMPYHDANNGGSNVLLKNTGSWTFFDVTKTSGLGGDNLRFTLASVWEDYDNDGDPDLYIANDFGRNNLFRNDNGTFTDVAAQAGVEDIGPGMSAAWGDANNDGLIDLYVSNMFSSAGSRITRQSQFQQSDLAGFQRHARGNSLFINQGDGTFQDEAESSGTVMARWAWGSQFVDLNNDGWRDLYVTNGFVTADERDDDL